MLWRFEGIELVLVNEACHPHPHKTTTCSLAFGFIPRPNADWWTRFSSILREMEAAEELLGVDVDGAPIALVDIEIDRVPETFVKMQEAVKMANEDYRKEYADVLEAQQRLDAVLAEVPRGRTFMLGRDVFEGLDMEDPDRK
jgi:hypothetical protein